MSSLHKTYCSECGGVFGPGNEDYAHCKDHEAPRFVGPSAYHACGWPSCGCDPSGVDSPGCRADHANELIEAEVRTARNIRVQGRYDQLMAEGKHGHYETMFRVIREEVDAAETEAYAEGRADERAQVLEELRAARATLETAISNATGEQA